MFSKVYDLLNTTPYAFVYLGQNSYLKRHSALLSDITFRRRGALVLVFDVLLHIDFGINLVHVCK